MLHHKHVTLFDIRFKTAYNLWLKEKELVLRAVARDQSPTNNIKLKESLKRIDRILFRIYEIDYREQLALRLAKTNNESYTTPYLSFENSIHALEHVKACDYYYYHKTTYRALHLISKCNTNFKIKCGIYDGCNSIELQYALDYKKIVAGLCLYI